MADHIVRHKDAYYPSAGYGGWTEEQHQHFLKNSTIIHHPIYDPVPMKEKPSMWARAIAWALAALHTAP